MVNSTLGAITLGGSLGGVKIINQPADKLPQDIASGFYIAQEGFVGSTFEPVWYVGTQLVNGVNHVFIAEQTLVTKNPEKHIVAITINIPPGYVGGKGATIVKITDCSNPDVPADILNIISDNLKDLVGASHKPVIYLGSQIVRGINYFVVAESKAVAPNAQPYASIIKINNFAGKNSVSIENLLQN